MLITFRNGFLAGLLLAAIFGIYLYLLWQPEEQIKRHTQHLLEKIEQRKWNDVAAFIDEDFHDQWEDDRARLLERLRLVLNAVRNFKIEPRETLVVAAGREGKWSAKIRVSAEPGEVATLIEERVNHLDEPFVLEWRQQSRAPWNWKLVAVKNPALEIPAGIY